MKHIRIITLSIMILICCLSPVVSAELNETGNDTGIAADDPIDLNDHSSNGKKWIKFHIEAENTYHVGDKMRFHVTFNPDFEGPVTVHLDDSYTTKVTSDTGQFYITLDSSKMSPGRHCFWVEYSCDDEWYYEGCAHDFLLK